MSSSATWPSRLRKMYRRLKRHVRSTLPKVLPADSMNEVQGYLTEASQLVSADFSVRGLSEVVPVFRKLAAFRSRVAAVQISVDMRLAVAQSLRHKADFALSTVRAVLAESDSVTAIGRADLRREKIFALSAPVARIQSSVRSRVLILDAQSAAVHLTLSEIDSLQRNLSRQVSAIQLDLTTNQSR